MSLGSSSHQVLWAQPPAPPGPSRPSSPAGHGEAGGMAYPAWLLIGVLVIFLVLLVRVVWSFPYLVAELRRRAAQQQYADLARSQMLEDRSVQVTLEPRAP